MNIYRVYGYFVYEDMDKEFTLDYFEPLKSLKMAKKKIRENMEMFQRDYKTSKALMLEIMVEQEDINEEVRVVHYERVISQENYELVKEYL